MTSACAKVKQSIRRKDLFGVPVMLSFQGETSFNTVCGGIVSITLIVALTVGFFYQLHQLIFHPVFMTLPSQISLGKQIVTLPSFESTLAVQVFNMQGDTNSVLRIQFMQSIDEKTYTVIPGVYCRDFYSEQIEAERNGQSPDDFYIKNFNSTIDDKFWVCPNTTALYMADGGPLLAEVVPCGQAQGDEYAAGVTC